jgi:arylamine N-acetyltransferase
MEGQSRAIPFENLDVVQRKVISMAPADVERKLVAEERGTVTYTFSFCMYTLVLYVPLCSPLAACCP